MYIIELEKGVWLAPWEGDPGRTLDINKAKIFHNKQDAEKALKDARQYRPFVGGGVYKCL